MIPTTMLGLRPSAILAWMLFSTSGGSEPFCAPAVKAVSKKMMVSNLVILFYGLRVM